MCLGADAYSSMGAGGDMSMTGQKCVPLREISAFPSLYAREARSQEIARCHRVADHEADRRTSSANKRHRVPRSSSG